MLTVHIIHTKLCLMKILILFFFLSQSLFCNSSAPKELSALCDLFPHTFLHKHAIQEAPNPFVNDIISTKIQPKVTTICDLQSHPSEQDFIHSILPQSLVFLRNSPCWLHFNQTANLPDFDVFISNLCMSVVLSLEHCIFRLKSAGISEAFEEQVLSCITTRLQEHPFKDTFYEKELMQHILLPIFIELNHASIRTCHNMLGKLIPHLQRGLPSCLQAFFLNGISQAMPQAKGHELAELQQIASQYQPHQLTTVDS